MGRWPERAGGAQLRRDVLVQPEEIVWVVLALQRHEPLVFRVAVDLSAVGAGFGYIVDVAPGRHERLDLRDRRAPPHRRCPRGSTPRRRPVDPPAPRTW